MHNSSDPYEVQCKIRGMNFPETVGSARADSARPGTVRPGTVRPDTTQVGSTRSPHDHAAHDHSGHHHSVAAVAEESGLPLVPASLEAIDRTAEVFKALATSSRLRILLILSHGPSTVTGIVDLTDLSQPLVSQHLKLLRGLGLVEVQRRGREAIYSLKDDHVAHMVVDALAHVVEDH